MSKVPSVTAENEQLTKLLDQLHLEFVDLFTRHKNMVDNESDILTAVYPEKLGYLQLENLQKQTEAARLKMKMNLRYFILHLLNVSKNAFLGNIFYLISLHFKIYPSPYSST